MDFYNEPNPAVPLGYAEHGRYLHPGKRTPLMTKEQTKTRDLRYEAIPITTTYDHA